MYENCTDQDIHAEMERAIDAARRQYREPHREYGEVVDGPDEEDLPDGGAEDADAEGFLYMGSAFTQSLPSPSDDYLLQSLSTYLTLY